MQIFCTDGTTLECAAFRALDAGILVFDEEPDGEEAHDEATGFVPLTHLRYVLPDDAQPGPQQRGAQRPQAAPAGGMGGQPGGQFGGGGGGVQGGPGGPGGRSGGIGGQPGPGGPGEQR